MRGQDIVNFQEDLADKVQGRVSSKWFYTHIRPSTNEKLPRVDMLNMLSQYVGYKDWSDFIYRVEQEQLVVVGSQQAVGQATERVQTKVLENDSKEETSEQSQIPQEKAQPLDGRKTSPWAWLFGWIGVAVIVLMGSWLLSGVLMKQEPPIYRFCFVNADTEHAIADIPIEILLLKEGESPMWQQCNDDGCFEFKSNDRQVRFAVRARYFKLDTLTRVLNQQADTEYVKLRTDDYALMIHIFSNARLEDWEKRRTQLDKMIADDAQIFQVYKNTNLGMEMYNKEDFINKLTMPIKSLGAIEVLETVYNTDGQIREMRFTQNP